MSTVPHRPSAARERILVIDDDTEIRAMLRRTLLAEGFDVDTAPSAEQGIEVARVNRPDLVVMDIGLPGTDGVAAVAALRDLGLWMPVLMLTAHGELNRRLDSFAAGADDFLPKPFHHEELLARMQALMRRSQQPQSQDESNRIRRGDLLFDPDARRCFRGEREVELSPREFQLLELLVRNPGVVLSRARIEDEIWDDEITEGSNTVDVYVGYLRRKLEAEGEPRLIHTVRGHGFIFRSDD